MMYSDYERPKISATIFYYDREYCRETAEKVIGIAEQFGLFPPSKIHADKLTQGRFRVYRPSMRDIAVKAYSEKNVFSVFWELPNIKEETDSFTFEWTFTFYKSRHLRVEPSFKPWNTLTLMASYGWLRDEANYSNYLAAFKSFICALKPFYANIDDVAQEVSLLQEVHAPHFVPDKIQQIYWGNYWSGDFQRQIDSFCAPKYPVSCFEKIENGIFFTLSDSLLDFDSEKVNKLRKQIYSQIR